MVWFGESPQDIIGPIMSWGDSSRENSKQQQHLQLFVLETARPSAPQAPWPPMAPHQAAQGEAAAWCDAPRGEGGRGSGAGEPAEPPSDDDSTQAVWGDPGDQEVLEVTLAQESLYRWWWRIREEERVQLEEVD